MTEKQKEYAFVIDCNGKQLSPTNINKAWILIRKQRATLVSKYPMVIQIKKEIKDDLLEQLEAQGKYQNYYLDSLKDQMVYRLCHRRYFVIVL